MQEARHKRLPGAGEKGECGVTGYGVFFWGDEYVSELDRGGDCTIL